ncbi:unnamed protein product [Cylicocyclus nassatus]|uniref:G-protein coupled receptors family 1 profile domain-containing protein n=1 Tax=Cylicocyclus nassatus TaxID=53992 RepID=A0AA36GJ58_CYLNA|nr:unnamed protein product [Cylicocyclus nassatus]
MDNETLIEMTSTLATVFSATVSPDCNVGDPYLLVPRFWLAVVFGITISIISIVFNSFVFVIFFTNKQHRNSYNLYLLLLAMFDVFMGISYIAVISVKVLINWTVSYTLKAIWVMYMVPMLTVSHIAQTASSFLIIFAAIERYCITVNSDKVKFLQNHRKAIVFVAVMCGVISKGTILKEITVARNPDCPGTVGEWYLEPSSLVIKHELFNKIWRFYFRNVFTILAPFFIVLYLNAGLIYRLQEHSLILKSGSLVQDKQIVKQKKARIRAATRTLVMIVFTYLISNLLSVIITIWEYLDSASLFSEPVLPFYVMSVDAISLLTIVASCLRLPIYITCQPLLRKEMFQFISQIWTQKLMSRRLTLIENSQLTAESLVNNADNESPSFGKIEFV